MVETITVVIKVVQSNFLCFSLLLVMLCGCNHTQKDFHKGWCSNDEYFFDYTSLNDTVPCGVMFHLMPDKSYRYKNFSFEFLVVDPHFKMYKDTVSVMLDTTMMFKTGENHLFMSGLQMVKGDYRFRVKQIMCDTLKGIKDFKLRIVPQWEKIK